MSYKTTTLLLLFDSDGVYEKRKSFIFALWTHPD
ncbi:hypothetical protein BC659_1555 [Sediminibacterium goheungense]|uniref:Uncharacterized protein n=1 Tax=Sediminibacterium goheungense TaxID=1086393 RepID=A0A4R6IUH4_9BACT|nr:hypothetical protein BC659_1555 [Sediminibacterium goheungense]